MWAEHAGRPAGRSSGRHAAFRVAAVTRTRETIGRAARAVADGAALRAARGGDAPNLGSELAVAIGRRLGRLHTLTVKPWPPGATADPRALSRELGVDVRLSGAATRTGQQLAIALRIVSTDGERVLWEDAVEVPVSDLMWLESQIAQRVAAALDVPMSGKERAALARHMTESLDAYQWFLRGRLHFERRTKRDLREALAAFERATASDPNYALAYAWVANTWSPMGAPRLRPAVGDRPALRAAAERPCSTPVWPRRISVSRWPWALRAALGRRRGGVSPRARARSQLRHRSPLVFVPSPDRRTIRRGDDRATPCARDRSADADAERLACESVFGHAPARSSARGHRADARARAAHLVCARDRGQALAELGRHHEALQEFLEAERAAPDNFMAMASVVDGLVATGDVREARRRVAEAERLARSTYVSAFDLGLMRISPRRHRPGVRLASAKLRQQGSPLRVDRLPPGSRPYPSRPALHRAAGVRRAAAVLRKSRCAHEGPLSGR